LEITERRVCCASSPVLATHRALLMILLHRLVLMKNYAVTMPITHIICSNVGILKF
jgi:hypothetical protein